MTNEEFLQQLQSRGMITDQVAARIKRDAIVHDTTTEDLVAQERLVPDDKVAEMKSQILGVPYKAVDVSKIDEKLISLIPEETARKYGVIPLSVQDGLLV